MSGELWWRNSEGEMESQPIPATARRAGFPAADPDAGACYGRTVNGTPCQLPAGHYPATKHLIAYEDGRSWMAWTDESMAEFARIACETENAHICNEEHHHVVDGHVQTAIEDSDGYWHIECQCGARSASWPTNYEAWQERLQHA